MGKFAEHANVVALNARALARSIQSRLSWKGSPLRDKPAYRQPVRLIDGMPNAPEPCMLLEHWSEALQPRDAVVQLKVDGIRALYVDTSIVTRQALPLDCALHCLPGLVEIERAFGKPMVLDGEYQAPGGFEATLAEHKRGEGVGTFHLFDAVPFDEWKANRFTQPLRDRMLRLSEIVGALDPAMIPFVRLVPTHPVGSPAEARAAAERAWQMSQEGVVVKRRDSLYVRGRSRDWLKLKRQHTVAGKITDVVVEKRIGKAMLVRVGDHEGGLSGKIINVGSNIPSELREAIGRQPNIWDGRDVEVGFNDATDNGTPRGAFFVRMLDGREMVDV